MAPPKRPRSETRNVPSQPSPAVHLRETPFEVNGFQLITDPATREKRASWTRGLPGGGCPGRLDLDRRRLAALLDSPGHLVLLSASVAVTYRLDHRERSMPREAQRSDKWSYSYIPRWLYITPFIFVEQAGRRAAPTLTAQLDTSRQHGI